MPKRNPMLAALRAIQADAAQVPQDSRADSWRKWINNPRTVEWVTVIACCVAAAAYGFLISWR